MPEPTDKAPGAKTSLLGSLLISVTAQAKQYMMSGKTDATSSYNNKQPIKVELVAQDSLINETKSDFVDLN
jgi:hypothetical protein